MSQPTIIIPMSPERSNTDITPDMQFIIDYFEKKDAERNEIINDLRKKVKLLSGTLGEKGELDPWAASELTGDVVATPGSKRVREEVEGTADKPPGSGGVVRTATKARTRSGRTQASATGHDKGSSSSQAPR